MSDLYQARMRWSACSTGRKHHRHTPANIQSDQKLLHLPGTHAMARLQQREAEILFDRRTGFHME